MVLIKVWKISSWLSLPPLYLILWVINEINKAATIVGKTLWKNASSMSIWRKKKNPPVTQNSYIRFGAKHGSFIWIHWLKGSTVNVLTSREQYIHAYSLKHSFVYPHWFLVLPLLPWWLLSWIPGWPSSWLSVPQLDPLWQLCSSMEDPCMLHIVKH